MRADALAALRAIMRGDPLAESHVTPATPVTLQPGYRLKAIELQALQPLQAEAGKDRRGDCSPVTAPVTALPEPHEAAIEERAGLAADRIPRVYLDAWARLNCQKSEGVSEAEWRLAQNDGGRFLDEWGDKAARQGITPNYLFGVCEGLIWRLRGAHVVSLSPQEIRLSDGRTARRKYH
jgi:hypothetical protein